MIVLVLASHRVREISLRISKLARQVLLGKLVIICF